jgi:hypothetical protein
LRLDNLFDTVVPNLNDALVVHFTGTSHAQHVLARRNRPEDDAA